VTSRCIESARRSTRHTTAPSGAGSGFAYFDTRDGAGVVLEVRKSE
jgi:hypothetical protein